MFWLVSKMLFMEKIEFSTLIDFLYRFLKPFGGEGGKGKVFYQVLLLSKYKSKIQKSQVQENLRWGVKSRLKIFVPISSKNSAPVFFISSYSAFLVCT